MAVHSFVDLSPNSTWLFCCTGRLGLNDALINIQHRSIQDATGHASDPERDCHYRVSYKRLLASG